MEQLYKRVDDINEKVRDASLPYLEWKVLFLVGEGTKVGEVASNLDENAETISEIFSSLESKGFIESLEEREKEPETTAEKTEEEKPQTEISDEILIDDEEPEPSEQTTEKAESETDISAGVSAFAESTEEKPAEEQVTEKTEDQAVAEEIQETAKTEEESEESAQSAEAEKTDAEEIVTEGDFSLDIDEEEDSAEAAAATDEEVAVENQVETEEPSVPEESTVTEEPPESSVEETISDVSKKTILVIDDSIVIRKMIEIALEEEEYNISTAISGKEGLDIIDKSDPSLVILDMMLPDMNGLDVLKTIKKDKKIPVIMLSGKDSPQLIENAKEIGVDDFLPKPFRDEELVEKVKTLAGND